MCECESESVCPEGRLRQRECSSTFVRSEVKREKQILHKKWGNYISDCFANFLSFTSKRKITFILIISACLSLVKH